MVRDLHDELERALQAQPPWRLDLEEIVAAAHQARRRRRGRRMAGSSAAAVLVTGAMLAGPRLATELRGPVGGIQAGSSVPAAASRPPAGSTTPEAVAAEVARQRFVRAGYGYDDALLLARLWGGHVSPDQAEVRAGGQLIAGQQLPVLPGQTPQTVSADAALEAFFGNGYSYDDAVRLAKVWHEPTPGSDVGAIKVLAGRKILAGQTLPS